MQNNQFAIYRVDLLKAGKELKHLPYNEVRRKRLPVRIESYKQMHIGEMERTDKVVDIWKRTKVYTEVSDVLVINQNGEISCYYVDEENLRRINGFIQLRPTGGVVTIDTRDYHIEGLSGKWMAADTLIIDGKQFYYMEHQEYRSQVAGMILDSYGKLIAKNVKGFNQSVKDKIKEDITSPETKKEVGKTSVSRLELYQKYYENGTYERRSESGTEKSYNQIDGNANNLKEEEVSSASHRGQAQKKPKKRTSVIKKLHEKQVAIAKRSGKPVPKYLEQQMGAERVRK